MRLGIILLLIVVIIIVLVIYGDFHWAAPYVYKCQSGINMNC